MSSLLATVDSFLIVNTNENWCAFTYILLRVEMHLQCIYLLLESVWKILWHSNRDRIWSETKILLYICFLIELLWIHSRVYLYSLPINVCNHSFPRCSLLERHSIKRKVAGSNSHFDKNLSFCYSQFFRVPHSLTKRFRMKSSVKYT